MATDAVPVRLITPTDLGQYLQQGFPPDDLSVQSCVDLATSIVQTWCRRRIVPVDGDTMSTTGSSTIVLSDTPVRSVTSVKVNDTETIDSWILNVNGSISWTATTTEPTYTDEVVVEYDSGFLTTDYRYETARLVALRVASRLYQNPLDRGSFTGPDGLSYQPSAGSGARLLTGDEQMMLAPLRDAVGFA